MNVKRLKVCPLKEGFNTKRSITAEIKGLANSRTYRKGWALPVKSSGRALGLKGLGQHRCTKGAWPKEVKHLGIICWI